MKPAGYEAVLDAEKAELDRERIRLWYVAATRARELLVLPRIDAAQSKSAWISLVDLSLGDLPALDLSHLPEEMGAAAARLSTARPAMALPLKPQQSSISASASFGSPRAAMKARPGRC